MIKPHYRVLQKDQQQYGRFPILNVTLIQEGAALDRAHRTLRESLLAGGQVVALLRKLEAIRE